MKALLFLQAGISWAIYCNGQAPVGQNEVVSYTRNQYGAGTQNWAMEMDNYDRLYIANNEGLLVFDGTKWQIFPVPNKTILRSIRFGPGGKLYAGAQDELGYYAPDKVGRLQFTSLKYLLPVNEKNFTDVWQLEVAGQDVFFRTNAKIFKLNNENISIYPSSSTWLSMHRHQDKILAQDEKTGLMVYESGGWKTFIPGNLLPPGFLITAITPYKKDTSLLSTSGHGMYLLVQNKLLPFAFKQAGFNSNQHITSVTTIGENSLLVGTYFNGVYRISREGSVLETISTKNGLPNNTVRFVFPDKAGNAWIALDNGLACFAYNNPIKHINPPAFNNGAGYSAKVLNGDLYFALSTGLQWLPISSETDLSLINKEPQTITSGLTWNLSEIENQLFVGRDDGLWKINSHKATLVSPATGYWNCKAVPGILPLQFVAGNYLGIEKYEAVSGNVVSKGKVEKFNESSRYIETDSNNIWMSHPYRGIYKIGISPHSINLYTREKGLPSDLDNHVFKINNKIVFATLKGIYEYDAAGDKMVPAEEYARLFGQLPIRYLKEDEKGNIWFVQDKMAGVADYHGDKPVIHYIPELKNKILSGFENIIPYNSENILVGSEKGFYHINYEKYRQRIQPFTAYVTSLKITGRADSVLYGGYNFNSANPDYRVVLPYKFNSVHFDYAATSFGMHPVPEFSYFLEGFDKDWNHWSNNTGKEYTNLPAGNYTFHVKARRSPAYESATYRFSFTIHSPWYQTTWAYALYAILITLLLYTSFKYQARKHRQKQETRRREDQKKFEEEQKQTAYKHQIEMERTEKELIRLQNEKLEVEIKHKNAELAGATMNLVQKKEFILKLKAELQQLQKSDKIGNDNPELKKLLKVLAEEEKLYSEWEQFSKYFNSVHGDFLKHLKDKFPELKAHELKLCAYIRLNLSSKEIAQLMSISLRGVEISRYRVRKKLQVPAKEDLFQFLLRVEASGKNSY